LFYLLLAAVCLSYPTTHFTENTDSSFSVSYDSLSGTALRAYEAKYGESKMNIIAILTVPAGEDVRTSSDARAFAADLDSWSKNFTEAKCGVSSESTTYYDSADVGLSFVANQFVSPDNRSTFIYTAYDCSITVDYGVKFRDYADDHVPPGVSVGVTGIELFQIDTLAGIEIDLSKMDKTVLPLALLTLSFVLGSLPIMIIPIINILLTIVISFAVMYPVALCMQVVSFTPSVMMSLTVAMSVDYSLFLLSRCLDDVAAGADHSTSIHNMIEHAGHTIIASGTTLCICFLGMVFFPLDMLRSVGIGATVSILVALGVNLTMTPAMLVKAPWLLRPGKIMSMFCCAEEGTARGAGSDLKRRRKEGRSEDEGKTDAQLYNLIDSESMYKSGWYKVCRVLLQPKYGVPIFLAVVGLMMPVCVRFMDLEISVSFDLLLPATSPSLLAFDQMGEDFGFGTLSPYKLMFDGTATESAVAGSVTSNAFEAMHAAINELSGLPATPTLSSFSGIAALGGVNVTYAEYEAAIICGKDCGHNVENPTPEEELLFEAARSMATLAEQLNSADGFATYATVVLNVDPFSAEGTDWLQSARDKLSSLASAGSLGGYDAYLVDGAGVPYDTVNEVYDTFPLLICLTLVTVFVLMGVFFRSVVVPVRSVLSIALTLAFVFGLQVMVYQDGAFEWVGLGCVSKTDYINWLPPVMTFSIVVGLGLDYDVFLISRVLEFRLEGLTADSSVLKGVWKTGGVITCAGIIMAVAFCGLLMSEERVLNQTAFVLVASVLVDTFVVRTVLVPILLGVTGEKSWWPRAIPEGVVDLKDGELQKEEEDATHRLLDAGLGGSMTEKV